MNSVLKTVALFAVLFGLTCGIPIPIKFEEVNLKPGPDSANATVRMHHMALDNTILSFKAKASSPSDVLFTLVIKVVKYDCVNVNCKMCIDNLGCSYDFQSTLAVSDDAEITWRTQTVGDYGEMVITTYCGKDVDSNHLADITEGVYFSYNENKEFNIHIQKTSIYVVFINLFANYSQKDIEHFTLSYRLEVAAGHGYLGFTDKNSLFIFWVLVGMYISIALVWMITLVIAHINIFKIQLWILLVILLVVLEKAMFAGLYIAVDHTGVNIEGHPLYVIAELISSARNLLTKLLLVVSFGYGTTVKPNVDSQMNRVVSIGVIYGVLSFLDGITRACGFSDNTECFTTIPLAIVDSIILYWVITSNRDTRPIPKVQCNDNKPIHYNWMINTVAFLMLIDMIFRLRPIIYTRLSLCLSWWGDYLYELVSQYCLCSIILYIMYLWKPSRDPATLFFNPVVYGKDDFEESKQEKFGNAKICNIDSDLKENHSLKRQMI